MLPVIERPIQLFAWMQNRLFVIPTVSAMWLILYGLTKHYAAYLLT